MRQRLLLIVAGLSTTLGVQVESVEAQEPIPTGYQYPAYQQSNGQPGYPQSPYQHPSYPVQSYPQPAHEQPQNPYAAASYPAPATAAGPYAATPQYAAPMPYAAAPAAATMPAPPAPSATDGTGQLPLMPAPEIAPGGMPGAADVPPAEPEFVIPDVDQTYVTPYKPKKRKKIWSGSAELGLDGTDGNSQTFDLRFGFDAKRKTDFNVLSLDVDYLKKTNDGNETANRSYLDTKYERLFQNSPLTAVAHSTVDYDEFKAYDVRTTVDLALGYRIVDREDASFTVRAGAGAANEYGGPDEGWVPEAVFGAEYDRQLNDRHRLSADVEYTPEIEEFGKYIVTTRASWEIVIDADMNLSLKLSAKNRYDSHPGGVDPNDLDYSATLLWSF